MSERDDPLPDSPKAEPRVGWTRLEDYLDLERLWRRSSNRRRRQPVPRSTPEQPRFSLGTLPVLVLMAVLAVLAVAIIIAAVPGRRHYAQPGSATEPGTAAPGWLDR